MEISVVIPLYKGKKYIPYLLDVLSINFRKFYETYHMRCEAVFVNDYPDETIELPEHDICTSFFHMEQNQGIHGARIFGYWHTRGKYVLFLDQDDKISEDYLTSQWKSLGNADAVVCNGYRERLWGGGKRAIYTKMRPMEKAKALDCYVAEGNMILSPGQVLIRKSAIPELWLREAMEKNGADDYYLWLLMLQRGCVFALNSAYLYTHTEHGYNASNDIQGMVGSIKEMLSLLERNHILKTAERAVIDMRAAGMANVPSVTKQVQIYDQWVYLHIRGIKIKTYLQRHGFQKIAIYGMGHLGYRLYDELKHGSVEVILGIDRNADAMLAGDLPVLSLENPKLTEHMEKVDVVVTTVSLPQETLRSIRKFCGKPIVPIGDILLDLIIVHNAGGDSD